ncbi:zinc finger BED domain-containing 1-like protein [Labeo rohita]|uniref:Zinc finger BED domain-containing 1-like protein n=1 Tax=Labeo rohita TaxID=84645 RepID=A0A498MSB8_LABRO|nr:zinc finger BED domain-containing 1-like protein [Labeo rohita]
MTASKDGSSRNTLQSELAPRDMTVTEEDVEPELSEFTTPVSPLPATERQESICAWIWDGCSMLEQQLKKKAIKTRFAEVLESEDAVLAAVTLPKFKLRWLRTQDRKDKAKASLLAECRKLVLDQDQQAGTSTSTPTCHQSRDSAIEDEFFSFEDEDDTSSTAESEVTDYFKSGAQEIDSLNGFALIKKISLRYNAATPSSAPVERLFSLGKLVITPKRNRLSDQKFEKLLVLRYNHWFNS